MSKKILLLDTNYQAQAFISLRKAIKHIYKEKTDVLASWENDFLYFGENSKIEYPAILRLKNPIKRNYYNTSFNRPAIIKRDNARCQYCNKKLTAAQITIDHIVPRSQGGQNTFVNCVVACHSCNNSKGDRTPDKAGLTLIKTPINPVFSSIRYSLESNEPWHPDWNDYLNHN